MNEENWFNELESIEDASWIYSTVMDIRHFLAKHVDSELMEYMDFEYSNSFGG